MDKIKEQLKKIFAVNNDMHRRIEEENWDVKYNKESDFLIMGTKFPENSFYFYVNGSGVMIRVDGNNKIYGFAIENTKKFIKNNAEIGWLFYPIVHPIKFFWMYLLWRGIDRMKRITAVTDYIAGEACFINS